MAKSNKGARGMMAQAGQNAAEREAVGIRFDINEALTYVTVQAALVHQAGLGLVCSAAVALIVGYHLQPPDARRKVSVIMDDMHDAIKLKGYGKSSIYRYLNSAKSLVTKLVRDHDKAGPIAEIAACKTAEEACAQLVAHMKTLQNKQRPNGVDTLDSLDRYVTGGTGRTGGKPNTGATAALAEATTAIEADKATLFAERIVESGKLPEGAKLPGNLVPTAILASVMSAAKKWPDGALVKIIRESKRDMTTLCTELFRAVETPDELAAILKAGHERLNEMQAQVLEAKNIPAQGNAAQAEGRAN